MDETSGAPGAIPQWELVDEGWGREAVDFATLSEPGNCREYVAVHHALGVDRGDHLLDVACGSGLALELAHLRGARCAGIDASPRLAAVARDRVPDGDVRVGDMLAMPWPDATFDVVTSFRGVWGTTEDAIGEIRRVLKPGGRLGFTVWGHIKASPGAWALAPFRMAAPPQVENQVAMVSLGRPGAGEALLERYGFGDVARLDVPFAWEFADPSIYARALASSGPAYEAIQNVGEKAFVDAAVNGARPHLRDGLPLRAESRSWAIWRANPPHNGGGTIGIDVGIREKEDMNGTGFLATPADSPQAQAHRDEDQEELGYVMNGTELWAYQPETVAALFGLMGQSLAGANLTLRQRGVLVAAAASARGRLVLLAGLGAEALGVRLARGGGRRDQRGRRAAHRRRACAGRLGSPRGPRSQRCHRG